MKTIGLFLGTTEDSYGKEVVHGVAEVLAGTGHRLICFTSGTIRSHHGYEAQRNVLYDLVGNGNVDALIVSGSLSHNVSQDELISFCQSYAPIPLVTMSVSLPGFPSVVVDNRAGFREVVEHLIVQHGLTRLVHVSGPPGQQESEIRKEAFLTTVARAGLTVPDGWVLAGDYTRDSGQRAAQDLLRLLETLPADERPQGVVCANDSMALGIHEALQGTAWTFPDHLVVTGFDDTPEGRVLTPALTTVWQSPGHVAQEAARLVLRILDGLPVPEVTQLLPTLLVRQSCGCVPGERTALVNEENLLAGGRGVALKSELTWAFAHATASQSAEVFLGPLQELLRGPHLEAETFATALLDRMAIDASPEALTLIDRGRTVVAQAALARESRERALTGELLDRLRNTTEDMLTSESLPQLLGILHNNLLRMGFPGFWLSLFANPAQPATFSRLHLAHHPDGREQSLPEGLSFPSRELVPGGLGTIAESETLLVVEALYSRNARLGFILFSSDLSGTQITGTLRGQLSGALQAVLLLEERKQAELHLIQTEKMAALGSLVAGVAHEINTPLGVAITASSFLSAQSKDFLAKYRQGQATKSEFESFLNDASQVGESIQVNLGRAADLIASFKQVSADQASEQRRQFALKEYLQDALLSLHFQWKNHDVEVVLEGPSGQRLDSFPGAIVQIVTNLLSNSLLHAFEPGRHGVITLRIEDRGSSVLLEFQDNGVGIPLENQARIFEPFFTTKRGRGGTGLGLHIVFNLVNNVLGGAISCASTPGQGTRFTLLLPRTAP